VKKIDSIQNPLIKEIEKLKKHPEDKIFIEGKNLIEAALNSPLSSIDKVLLTEEFAQTEIEFLKSIEDRALPVIILSQKIAKKISDTVTPQGIFALINYKIQTIKNISLKEPSLIVIADKIRDPGNLGTLIRVAEAFGTEVFFVTKETCNPFLPKTLRASAGSLFFFPIIKTDGKTIKEYILKHKLSLVITDPHAENLIFQIDFKKPMALVFGNERQGVSEEISTISHIKCRIPHIGKTESLNVAISASITLYEVLRQRTLSAM